ncbi:MAG TPA: transglutaminase domain-containing protein [Thermoplasmata archaeon]|nr:transglutaminase domain-containing protein [Thermoplasmata archaeon]HIH98374.1 transglutaminase domain-containing protein [Thermoplasmata archaeon]
MKKEKLFKIGVLLLLVFLSLPCLANQSKGWEEDLAKKIAIATDYRDRNVKKFASHLADEFERDDELEQVRLIYKHLENRWTYRKDPQGYQHFAKASEMVDRGLAGDSDDFAIAIASLFRAMGKPARIAVAYKGDKIKHIYAEVFLPKEALKPYMKGYPSSIWWDWDQSGGWVNLDYLSGGVGGPFRGGDEVMFVSLDGGWWLVSRQEEW